MSLLTDKAKQDFENYLMKLGCDEWDIIRLSKEEKEYYTIQFLDSVGIFYTISHIRLCGTFRYGLDYPSGIDWGEADSRIEATTEAIKQANIIYNNR